MGPLTSLAYKHAYLSQKNYFFPTYTGFLYKKGLRKRLTNVANQSGLGTQTANNPKFIPPILSPGQYRP